VTDLNIGIVALLVNIAVLALVTWVTRTTRNRMRTIHA
jgi:hypothetical protein